jgi:hypothetical protein
MIGLLVVFAKALECLSCDWQLLLKVHDVVEWVRLTVCVDVQHDCCAHNVWLTCMATTLVVDVFHCLQVLTINY